MYLTESQDWKSLKNYVNYVQDDNGTLSACDFSHHVRFLIHYKQVEIDVDYAESSRAKELVEDVMLPSRTVMDLVDLVFFYFKDALPNVPCRA